MPNSNYYKRLNVPTQPTQKVQPIQNIQSIQKTQSTPSTAETVSIQKQMEIYRKAQKEKDQQTLTFLANYNDPTELNSYIDALTNREAVSKKFGDVWGTVSTASGIVAVLAFIAAAALGVAAAFTGGATAPAAGATASAGVKAATGAAAGAGAATAAKAAAASAALKAASATAMKVAGIAALPSFPAAVDVTYNYGIKPIVHGKPKEALLNTMMNLGETADFAANPVKGLFIEGPDGFLKGTGLTDSGRVNYDYDTGTVVSDILLEIVSDPMNWIEGPTNIAKTGVAKAGAKSATKELLENVVQQAVNLNIKEISQSVVEEVADTLTKRTAKILRKYTDDLLKTTDDTAKIALKKQAQQSLQTVIINTLKNELDIDGTAIDQILKKAGRDQATGRFTKSIMARIENADLMNLDKLSTDVLKGLTTITQYTDAAQKFMTRRAFFTSGYGAGLALIKENFKPILQWQNNHVVRRLATIAPQYFSDTIGLKDLSKFEEAKAFWEHLSKRAELLGTTKSGAPLHSIATFYAYMHYQFDRDNQLIRKAIQDHATDPMAQAAALDAMFQKLYNTDFRAYVEYLKKIDEMNPNHFKAYSDYAEYTHDTLMKQGSAGEFSAGVHTSAQLYAAYTFENVDQAYIKALEILESIANTTDINSGTKKIYSLKLNDYLVTSALLNDSRLQPIFMMLASDQNFGAFLDKIIEDARTLESEISAEISDCVRRLKDAGKQYKHMRDFFDNVGKILVPTIKNLPAVDLKRYIIDQIFNMSDLSVTELLTSFDSITAPDLINKLETFLYDLDFKVDNYPHLREQITGVFKHYLDALKLDNLDKINTTIVQDYTSSTDTLLKYFGNKYPELLDLTFINEHIEITMASIKRLNRLTLSTLLFDSESIFKVYNTRQLADLGLALRTINTVESLELFDDISDLLPIQHLEVENIGKRLLRTIRSCEQYSFWFDSEFTDMLDTVYSQIFSTLIRQDSSLEIYLRLRPTTDPFEQFAQLIELRKAINTNDDLKKNWTAYCDQLWSRYAENNTKAHSVLEVFNAIEDPNAFFRTQFAWDAMKQSAFYAEKAFNEDVINLLNTYKNITLSSKKILNDFNSVRKLLSTNKADLPKVVQLERYSKAAKRVVDTMDWFKEQYDMRYNRTIAKNRIAALREILAYFPEDQAQYSTLVDQLEQYWNGTLTFIQEPKWKPNAKDTFTPFYEKIKDMNRVLAWRVQQYNDEIWEIYQDSILHLKDTDYYEMKFEYDEAELLANMPHHNAEELNAKLIPFDNKELASRKLDKQTYLIEPLAKLKTEAQESRKEIYAKYPINEFDNEKLNSRKLDKQTYLTEPLAKAKAGFQEGREEIYAEHPINEFDNDILKTRKLPYAEELQQLKTELKEGFEELSFKKLDKEALKAKCSQFDTKAIRHQIDSLRIIVAHDPIKENRLAATERIKELQQLLEDYKVRRDEIYNEAMAQLKLENANIKTQRDLLYWHYSRAVQTIHQNEFLKYLGELNLENQIAKNQRNAKVDLLYRLYTKECQEIFDNYINYNNNEYYKYIGELNLKNKIIKDQRNAEIDLMYNLYTKERQVTYDNYINYNNNEYYKYIGELNTANALIRNDHFNALRQSQHVYYQEYRQTIKDLNAELFDQKMSEIQANNMAAYMAYKEMLLNYKAINVWEPIQDQQAIRQVIYKATNDNARSSMYRLLNWTPEQLKQELAFRKRFITFSNEDLHTKDLATKFKRLQALFKDDQSVHFIYDKNNERWWIVLDKNQKVTVRGRVIELNGKQIFRQIPSKTFNEFKAVDDILEDSIERRISTMLNNLNDDMRELTGSDLGDSMGEFFNKDSMQKIIDQMPEDVKALIDPADLLNDMWYEAYNFNESIMGGIRSRMKLGMLSSDMLVNAQNTITNAMCYVKAKTEYVHTVFDSIFSIGGKNSIFKDYSDLDILTALQTNPDYKLVAYVNDKKYGVRVHEILPTNVDAIAKARELNTVIVPLQTYKDMVKVVNHRLGSEGWLKIWNRIIYTYKAGYLLRPGAWIRNWIDTNIKTNLELGASDARTYRNQARKLLNERDRINDILAKRGDGVLKREALEEYFKLNPDGILNMQTYKELDYLLESQGALGNIMKDLQETEGGDIWNTFTHYSGKIVDTANQTENVNRLAVYLAKLDEGLDTTAALTAVAKTHFDYSYKTMAEQLLEMVFPFATFTLRNLSYWAEALEKHPWLMRYYVHFMKPSWDFKDFTPEQLATNYTVQNQILNGQLKLTEFNNKLITFKLNPSIQDAISMFSDPINNIYEKLAAPISTPLELATGQYTQPTNMLPLLGPMIQDIKTTVKTGSPVPSIIGVQKVHKPYVKFKNKNLSQVNSYTDNTYRTPKYRNNIVFDSYATKGITRYRMNFYPVIDIAHDIKSRYTTNVYNRIKNRVKTDVYQGIIYRIRLDANRFR